MLRFDELPPTTPSYRPGGPPIWLAGASPAALERTGRVCDGWLPYPVTTRWLPDAVAGPMGSLLAAVAEGGEPETSGADNLGTLALLHALYRSMETGESSRLGEG